MDIDDEAGDSKSGTRVQQRSNGSGLRAEDLLNSLITKSTDGYPLERTARFFVAALLDIVHRCDSWDPRDRAGRH